MGHLIRVGEDGGPLLDGPDDTICRVFRFHAELAHVELDLEHSFHAVDLLDLCHVPACRISWMFKNEVAIRSGLNGAYLHDPSDVIFGLVEFTSNDCWITSAFVDRMDL